MRDWNAAERGRLAAMLGLAAESLQDPGHPAPWAADRSLASLAPAAQTLLEEKDPKVRALAGWALETIHPKAQLNSR